jgi:hypothetical protein
MKKEATQKNAKRLLQNTSDEIRGNPEKRKRAHSKRPPMKNKQPRKTQRGSFKRPSMKKEATPKNAKGLIQKDL